MNTKKRRTIYLAIGLLLLALTVVLGIRFLSPTNAVVASSPDYSVQSEQPSSQETIKDNSIPLASAQSVQTVQAISLVSELRAVDADSTSASEEPAVQSPVSENPVAPETPTEPETPVVPEEPVVKSTAATRLLERANTLLTQFYACASNAEKRALLEAPNYSLGNDAMRTKLLADMGGSWESLEEETVDATQYQQGKTLFVQVYMSDVSSNYVPVIYTTQNSDRSGNQWATNLIYDDETGVWMEYTQKHEYNDSRVGFYMTTLHDNADGFKELKDTMETSDVWQEVVVPDAEADAPAVESITEG